MAAPTTYYWQAGDTTWWVAAKFYALSGYTSVYAFVSALVAANPQIAVWTAVTIDTPVNLPAQQVS